MSLSERDLREALAPLAGDPLRDAHAVLAGLPPGPPPPPPGLPPATWWLTGAALVVGLALGLGIGWASAGTGVDEPVAESATEKPQEKPPEPPPVKKMEPEVELMAFGDFWLTEPPEPPVKYKPGGWWFDTGSTIRTLADSRAGLRVLQNDVQVRFDRETEALLASPTQFSVTRGRVFVNTGSAGPEVEVEVETPLGKVMVSRGQVMVTASPQAVEVLSVMGGAIVRPDSEPPRQIKSRQRVLIDVDRGAAAAEDLPFLGTVTSWMTQMIILQSDESEMRERVYEMVRVYERDDRFRDAAAREIRVLDHRCVTSLVYTIQEREVSDETYRRNAAELVGQISNFFTAEYLFPLLDDADPVVRTTIFLALVEATGTDGDTGTTFWREASSAERQAAIAEWKQKLR